MIAAYTPDLAEPNDAPPSGPAFSDARAKVEEIEQLHLAGFSTYDIAARLDLRPRDVGRNLREIRKRYQRAARRQTQAFAVGHCAAIQREAMEGWRRSQEPKRAVTTRRKSGEPDVVTTRTEDRGGNGAFLNTALRAMKQLRQIAAEAPPESRKASDAVRLALLEVLTPAQAAALKPEQVQQFRMALDRWKVVLDAVEDGLHAADARAQVPPVAEPAIEAQAAPDLASTLPEFQAVATADAGTSDEAAKDDQSSCAARNDRQQTAKKTPPEPRHPEWPAESFLTRSWLPPDREFAANGRENAVCCPDDAHERNACAH